MKATEVIGAHLRATANEYNRSLVGRWNPSMETQLNVDPTKGTPVPGKKRSTLR